MKWTVVLCDTVRDRRDRIDRIIREAGAFGPIVETVAELDPGKIAGGDGVALIALGGACAPDPQALEIISQVKRDGLTAIAYEDGLEQWPLWSKCLPLLAGATHLLDSGSDSFVTELPGLLEQKLQQRPWKQQRDGEIRDLMRRQGLIGHSSALMDCFRSAMRFSELSDVPVLITGESGTGKELLARAIYGLDAKRKGKPFLAVNCAALNPGLMESVLFGHRRGAFTGAERDSKGLIRAAEGGVLFLDEIGELEVGLQAKLLRVLQENCVLSLGEDQERAVHVRFIAATNRNLEQLVAERKFREDLLHRLRVLLIHIPPLRDRLADLPDLIEYFVRKHRGFRNEAKVQVGRDFLEAIRQVELPGNVRQLDNLVCQSLVNYQGDGRLGLKDLPVDLLRQLSAAPPTHPASPRPVQPQQCLQVQHACVEEMNDLVTGVLDAQGLKLSDALRECERRLVQVALQRTHGSQSQAARLLGITVRSVYNKLRRHRLLGKGGNQGALEDPLRKASSISLETSFS